MGNFCTSSKEEHVLHETVSNTTPILRSGLPEFLQYFMRHGADLTPGNNVRGPRRVRPGTRVRNYSRTECKYANREQNKESYMSKSIQEMTTEEVMSAVQNPRYPMERFDRFDHQTLVQMAESISQRIQQLGRRGEVLTQEEDDAIMGMLRRTNEINMLRYGTIVPPVSQSCGDVESQIVLHF